MKTTGFAGREDKLQAIIRYNMDRRTPMFYRTNLRTHSRRVKILVNDILPTITPVYGAELDPDKTATLALVHDDAELLTGDVQLYYKDRMTKKELEKLAKIEAEAIEKLAQQWPEEYNGHDYKQLLYHALNKDCLEAQVVSWMDKVDAFCEALHEIHAGNPRFVGPAKAYIVKINALPEKYAGLQRIIGLHPLLDLPKDITAEQITQNGKLHTEESVKKETGIPQYDKWKELTIKYFGIGELTKARER